MLFTAPGLETYISGVILFDETIRQRTDDGRTFVELLLERGITPGIKVDRGTTPLAGARGERITEGLDGLRERLEEHRTLGARFAKWRAVIAIGNGRPSLYAIDMNAHALARYAALCQEMGMVPIVEPEVLMDGDHSLEQSFKVTEATLDRVFTALRAQRVVLEQMLLKPNMVLPGAGSPRQATVREGGRGGDRWMPATGGARGRAGHRLPVRRAGCADGDGAPECDEHGADRAAVATQLLLCARGAMAPPAKDGTRRRSSTVRRCKPRPRATEAALEYRAAHPSSSSRQPGLAIPVADSERAARSRSR